jgi:endonuclease/exonuclease/phosphatase family metal-dependent hydrolase
MTRSDRRSRFRPGVAVVAAAASGIALTACVPLGTFRAAGPGAFDHVSAAIPAASTTAPVELNVLSYNVHGFLQYTPTSNDPHARFPQIVRLADRYDVALYQEAWSYASVIASRTTHPVARFGNGADRNFNLFALLLLGAEGAGLVSTFDVPSEAVLWSYREPFRDYYSALTNVDGDGWVDKGFVATGVVLPNGVAVDFYNTYLDTDSQDPGNREARRKQLAQIGNAMDRYSRDHAVVLAGDLNIHATRPIEFAVLQDFAAVQGLNISLNESLDRERWHDQVDYILYRSSARNEVALIDGGEAREFLDAKGKPLSDHPAIFARFRIAAKQATIAR